MRGSSQTATAPPYWRAVEYVPELGCYCIRVVVWTVPGTCGLEARRYTGTSPWPTIPQDQDLRDWLRPVVAKGIPRTWLGTNPFSKNRLLKTIARTPVGQTQWKGQDLDMEVGHLQIRARRIPEDRRQQFPLRVQWGLQGDLSKLNVVAEHLQQFMFSQMSPLKLAKRIVVALSNGGSLENWARENDAHIDVKAMRLQTESEGAIILKDWEEECERLHEESARNRPDLAHHFEQLGRENPTKKKWYVACSVTCALDANDESRATGGLCHLAAKHKGIPIASDEHDGEYAWTSKSDNDDLLQKAVELTSFRMNEKPLDIPLAVAKEKYPHLAFVTLARLDATQLLDHWQLAKAAMGSKADARENSHSFTFVLRDRYQEKVMKTADGNFQIFGARGEWSAQRSAEELDELIAEDCLKLWAPQPASSKPGQMAKPPPAPFNNNEWLALEGRRLITTRQLLPLQAALPTRYSKAGILCNRTGPHDRHHQARRGKGQALSHHEPPLRGIRAQRRSNRRLGCVQGILLRAPCADGRRGRPRDGIEEVVDRSAPIRFQVVQRPSQTVGANPLWR